MTTMLQPEPPTVPDTDREAKRRAIVEARADGAAGGVEASWPQAAVADLRQIRDLIVQDDQRAAQAVAAAIKEAGNSLGGFPYKDHAGVAPVAEPVKPGWTKARYSINHVGRAYAFRKNVLSD